MNTDHISSILHSDPSTSQIFKGVMPRDHFVNCKVAFPGLYVCNTDTSDQPGSHWISIYFSKNGKCEYFDSYGVFSLFSDLTHKLLSIDKNLNYNNQTLQSVNTNVCGIYCIIFCMMRSRGFTLNYIINTFLLSHNSEERDHILKYFAVKEFSELSTHGQLPPIHQINGFSSQECMYGINATNK